MLQRDKYFSSEFTFLDPEEVNAIELLWSAVMSEFGRSGFGLVLRNKAGDRFALVMRDPSEAGRFRYQLFDSRGFSSHGTRDTVRDAIEGAFAMGFRYIGDPGVLDRLSRTEEWREGMRRVELIRLVNEKQITWEEAVARLGKGVDGVEYER